MRYAIILAGGTGSRFWPLSSAVTPKQFLKVYSDKTMLDETVRRISPLIKEGNIYLACGKIYNRKIKESAAKLAVPLKNVFFEPRGRNTLAPIAFLSRQILKSDPEAVIGVFPSDHFIKDRRYFLGMLKEAMDIADYGCIVTFGVPPKHPETGYGYIKVKGKAAKGKAYGVEKFTEKPDLPKAKRFLKDKRYYWNSGIFVFKAATMLKEIQRFEPGAYNTLLRINTAADLERVWEKIPALSIDYAVMEKTKNIVLLPFDRGWVDLGSWQAIGEITKKDKDGNVFKGNCIDIASQNTIAWSKTPKILATLGLKDIIIVNTDEALLVCSAHCAQDVRKISQILRQKKPPKKR